MCVCVCVVCTSTKFLTRARHERVRPGSNKRPSSSPLLPSPAQLAHDPQQTSRFVSAERSANTYLVMSVHRDGIIGRRTGSVDLMHAQVIYVSLIPLTDQADLSSVQVSSSVILSGVTALLPMGQDLGGAKRLQDQLTERRSGMCSQVL